MNLYRITKPKHARDLSGEEAKRIGGRWNAPGKAVVYTAGSSALALLEHMVHQSKYDLRLSFQLILIETYNTSIAFLEDFFTLSKDWKAATVNIPQLPRPFPPALSLSTSGNLSLS